MFCVTSNDNIYNSTIAAARRPVTLIIAVCCLLKCDDWLQSQPAVNFIRTAMTVRDAVSFTSTALFIPLTDDWLDEWSNVHAAMSTSATL